MPPPPAPGLPPRPARWRPALVVVGAALALHLGVAGLWQAPAAGFPRAAPAPTALRVVQVQTLAAVAAAPPEPQPAPAAPPQRARPEPSQAQGLLPPQAHAPLPMQAERSPAAQAEPAPGPAPPQPATLADARDGEGDNPDTPPPGTPESQPPPLYTTRVPEPVRLDFVLRRGLLGGRAQLLWQHDGERYTLDFHARAAGLPFIEQHSVGQLGAHGLAPERFTDRRRGRAAQAAHFRRDTGRITFSGPPIDHPAWPGAQDRLGWVVQLAAIHAAAASPPDEVTLFVAGARGGAGLWTFRALGLETVQTPLGAVQALRLRREPTRAEDLRAEVWLDPARGYWPVRMRTEPARGGEALDLLLAAEPARP